MNGIDIGVGGENDFALKFYNSVGFKVEGIQEQGYYYNNRYIDFVMMRILYDDWKTITNNINS